MLRVRVRVRARVTTRVRARVTTRARVRVKARVRVRVRVTTRARVKTRARVRVRVRVGDQHLRQHLRQHPCNPHQMTHPILLALSPSLKTILSEKIYSRLSRHTLLCGIIDRESFMRE